MNAVEQGVHTQVWLKDVLQDLSGTNLFIRRTVGRIVTSGNEQYYDPKTDKMLFETMHLQDLLTYAEEEALDLGAYAAMLAMKDEDLPDVKALAMMAATIWSLIEQQKQYLHDVFWAEMKPADEDDDEFVGVEE
jgi:hypothetical protein